MPGRLLAEVVEYACNLAPDLMGDYVENVSTGMDTYSIRQPLGVIMHAACCALLWGRYNVLLRRPASVNTGVSQSTKGSFLVMQVVAGICPFNFPAMIPLWMFPIACTVGNTFVLKPSEKDPGAAMMLAELALEAGLPRWFFWSLCQGNALSTCWQHATNARTCSDVMGIVQFVPPSISRN